MKLSTPIFAILACTLLGVATVIILYSLSEEIIHRNNSFIRRYPHHPVTQDKVFDLGYNSYYIAGITSDSIYLGNYTAPLILVAIDRELNNSTQSKISLPNSKNYSFRSIRIEIFKEKLILYDGSVPVLFIGDLRTKKVRPLFQDLAYFNTLKAVDTANFLLRTSSAKNGETELALIQLKDSAVLKINPELLTKQIDGVFDSDGFLLFNEQLQKAIYVYRYRNEYLLTTPLLKLENKGKLIDTISKAILEISELTRTKQIKLKPNSVVVTNNAETYGPYLFAQSGRLGKYEPEKMLDQASIIDVYGILDQTYSFSFYLYNYKNQRMRELKIFENQLFALQGTHLISYELNPNYFKPKDF